MTTDKPHWIMSPQAHRRLVKTMTESELRDLAHEILRDIESNLGIDSQVEVIYNTLSREY